MAQFTTRMVWIKILFPFIFMVGLGILPAEKAGSELVGAIRSAERDGQSGLAARDIYRLVEHQPWRMGLWEQAGSNQAAAGDYDSAIRDLERAAAMRLLSPTGRVLLATAYEETNRFSDASKLWAQIADAEPGSEVFSHVVNTSRLAGSPEGVIAALRKWQALEPFNPQVAYLLGLFLAVHTPDEALAQLTEAGRLEPNFLPALDTMQRAMALADLNADEAYRCTVIGRGLASLGEWDLAEQAFRAATQANPEYAEAWALLGEARLQLGEDGSKELEKALQTNPNSVLVRAMMALYLGREQKWEAAIDHLKVAARLEPDRGVWHIELGNLNAQFGDLVAAQSEYHTAIRLEPRNVQAWYALAAFCYQFGVDLEQTGEEAARQAVKLNDKNARSNDLLGAILVELGKEKEGEEYLLKAAELNPGLAEAHLHLGNLYLQHQQMKEAYEQLTWARRLDPEGATGDMARRMLNRYFDVTAESTPQP